LCQDFEHGGEVESALPEEHARVEPEVGDFAGERLIAFSRAGQKDFDRFLSNFAEDRGTSAVE
jgi:hypothetical protein